MTIKRVAESLGFAALMIANTFAMVSCAWMIHADGKERCVLRWAESSTPAKVTKAGCMVEKTPGNWVPEEVMKTYQAH